MSTHFTVVYYFAGPCRFIARGEKINRNWDESASWRTRLLCNWHTTMQHVFVSRIGLDWLLDKRSKEIDFSESYYSIEYFWDAISRSHYAICLADSLNSSIFKRICRMYWSRFESYRSVFSEIFAMQKNSKNITVFLQKLVWDRNSRRLLRSSGESRSDIPEEDLFLCLLLSIIGESNAYYDDGRATSLITLIPYCRSNPFIDSHV